MAVWKMWKLRNERVFNQTRHFGNDSQEILGFAHVEVVGSDNFTSNNGLKNEILISLAKPKGGWVRVNYKRSKSCPGLACAGDLFRDGNGRWLHKMDLAVLIKAIKASSSSLVVNRFLKSLIFCFRKLWRFEFPIPIGIEIAVQIG
ncbi:hypothetical protein NC652_020629 [Populus alba x Populus x berolinensis]|nr:hypothetical protein NC652_020629 [Populus alba x Populus x berolinensis]